MLWSLDYHVFELHVSFGACAHIPSTLWISTFYVTPMAMSTWEPMMEFVTYLLPWDKMLASTVDENNYIF
jgi:hypothetical protein